MFFVTFLICAVAASLTDAEDKKDAFVQMTESTWNENEFDRRVFSKFDKDGHYLLERLNSLEGLTRTLTTEVATLKDEIHDLKTKNENMENAMNELKTLNHVFKVEAEVLRETVKRQLVDINELREKANERDNTVDLMQTVLQSQENDIQVCKRDVIQLKKDCAQPEKHTNSSNIRYSAHNNKSHRNDEKKMRGKSSTYMYHKDAAQSMNGLVGINRRRVVRKRTAAANTSIAFSAYMSTDHEHISSGYILKCDQVLLNEGGAYNGHTGVLTVQVSGVYLLTFSINSYHSGTATYVHLMVDNRNLVDAVTWPTQSTHDVMAGNTVIASLSAGESVWLEVYGTQDGEIRSYSGYRFTTFSGVLLF